MMAERGTWLVPTLAAPRAVLEAAEAGEAVPESVVHRAREAVETHAASFRLAVSAGVKMALGTDAGLVPHGQNLRELALMSELGLAPGEALHAATGSAAELIGVSERTGTIQPGKVADLVVVEGDPFDVATLADRIRSVWKDGRMVAGRIPAEVPGDGRVSGSHVGADRG